MASQFSIRILAREAQLLRAVNVCSPRAYRAPLKMVIVQAAEFDSK